MNSVDHKPKTMSNSFPNTNQQSLPMNRAKSQCLSIKPNQAKEKSTTRQQYGQHEPQEGLKQLPSALRRSFSRFIEQLAKLRALSEEELPPQKIMQIITNRSQVVIIVSKTKQFITNQSEIIKEVNVETEKINIIKKAFNGQSQQPSLVPSSNSILMTAAYPTKTLQTQRQPIVELGCEAFYESDSIIEKQQAQENKSKQVQANQSNLSQVPLVENTNSNLTVNQQLESRQLIKQDQIQQTDSQQTPVGSIQKQQVEIASQVQNNVSAINSTVPNQQLINNITSHQAQRFQTSIQRNEAQLGVLRIRPPEEAVRYAQNQLANSFILSPLGSHSNLSQQPNIRCRPANIFSQPKTANGQKLMQAGQQNLRVTRQQTQSAAPFILREQNGITNLSRGDSLTGQTSFLNSFDQTAISGLSSQTWNSQLSVNPPLSTFSSPTFPVNSFKIPSHSIQSQSASNMNQRFAYGSPQSLSVIRPNVFGSVGRKTVFGTQQTDSQKRYSFGFRFGGNKLPHQKQPNKVYTQMDPQ